MKKIFLYLGMFFVFLLGNIQVMAQAIPGTKENPIVRNGISFWITTTDGTPLSLVEARDFVKDAFVRTPKRNSGGSYTTVPVNIEEDNYMVGVFKAEAANIRFHIKGVSNKNALRIASYRVDAAGPIAGIGEVSDWKQDPSDRHWYADVKGSVGSRGIPGRKRRYVITITQNGTETKFYPLAVIRERAAKYQFVSPDGSVIWPTQKAVFSYGSVIDAKASIGNRKVRFRFAPNEGVFEAPDISKMTFRYVNTNTRLTRLEAWWQGKNFFGKYVEGGFITAENYIVALKENTQLPEGGYTASLLTLEQSFVEVKDVDNTGVVQEVSTPFENILNPNTKKQDKIVYSSYPEEVIDSYIPQVHTRRILVDFGDASKGLFPENLVIILPGGSHEVFQNETLTTAQVEAQLLGVQDNTNVISATASQSALPATDVVRIVYTPITVTYNHRTRADADYTTEVYNMPIYVKPRTSLVTVDVNKPLTEEQIEAHISGIKNNPYFSRAEVLSNPSTSSAGFKVALVRIYYNDNGDTSKFKDVEVPVFVKDDKFRVEMYKGDGIEPYKQIVKTLIQKYDTDKTWDPDTIEYISFPPPNAKHKLEPGGNANTIEITILNKSGEKHQVSIPVDVWNSINDTICLSEINKYAEYSVQGVGQTPFFNRQSQSNETVVSWRFFNGDLNLPSGTTAPNGDSFLKGINFVGEKNHYVEEKISDGTFEKTRLIINYSDDIAPVIADIEDKKIKNNRDMLPFEVAVTENISNNFSESTINITGLPNGILWNFDAASSSIVFHGKPKDKLKVYRVTITLKDNSIATCSTPATNGNTATKTFTIRLLPAYGMVNPMLRFL